MSTVRRTGPLKVPPAPPRVLHPIGEGPPRPPSAGKDGTRMVGHLHRVVQEYHTEKEHLVDGINALQRNFEGLSTILTRERDDHHSLTRQCADLTAQLEDARSQLKLNGAVRAEWERLQREHAALVDSAARDAERDAERLRAALLDRDAALATVTSADAAAHAAGARVAQLTASLEESHRAAAEERRRREQAEAALATHEAEAARDRTAAQGLEATVARLEGEAARLRAEGLRGHEELVALRTAYQDTLQERSTLQAAAAAHSTTTTAAREETDRWRTAHAAADAALWATVSTWHDGLATLQNTHRLTLSDTEVDARALLLESCQAQGRLVAERAAARRHSGGVLAALHADRAAVEARATAERSALERRLAESEDARRRDQETGAAQEAEVRSELEQRIATLTARLVAEETETHRLRAQGAEWETERARRQAAAEETAASTHSATERRLADREAEGRRLAALLSDRDGALAAVEAERAALVARVAVLEAEGAASHARTDTTDRERETLGREVARWQKEVHRLMLKYGGLSTTISELKDALQAATTGRDDDKATITALEALVASLRQERESELASEEGKLRLLQERSGACLAKLSAAEDAAVSACTCLHCLKVYRRPMLLVPCGHTLCDGCIDRRGEDAPSGPHLHCPECDGAPVTASYPVEGLALLAGKVGYRRQALADLLREFAAL